MEEIILFILCFVFTFILYEIFIIVPAKRRKKGKSKQKKKDKELVEIKYLVAKYNINLEKINYNQLIQICGLVSCFDISVIVSFIMIVNNFIIRVLGGFALTIIIIILSYHFVYLFYKKKGMVVDGDK